MGCSASNTKDNMANDSKKEESTKAIFEAGKKKFQELKDKLNLLEKEKGIAIQKMDSDFYESNKEELTKRNISKADLAKAGLHEKMKENLNFGKGSILQMLHEELPIIMRKFKSIDKDVFESNSKQVFMSIQNMINTKQETMHFKLSESNQEEFWELCKYGDHFDRIEAISFGMESDQLTASNCKHIAEMIENFPKLIFFLIPILDEKKKSNETDMNAMAPIFRAIKNNSNLRGFGIGGAQPQEVFLLNEENQKHFVNIFDNKNLIMAGYTKFKLNEANTKDFFAKIENHSSLRALLIEAQVTDPLVNDFLALCEKSKILKIALMFGAFDESYQKRADEVLQKNTSLKICVICPPFMIR